MSEEVKTRMFLNELRDHVKEWSERKGWHEGWEIGMKLLLVLTEIAEATEEIRNHHPMTEVYYGPDGKPEGVPIEIADVIIRLADIAGYYGIDLEEALAIKLAYNEKRPYRHGGKAS